MQASETLGSAFHIFHFLVSTRVSALPLLFALAVTRAVHNLEWLKTEAAELANCHVGPPPSASRKPSTWTILLEPAILFNSQFPPCFGEWFLVA
jgi:hypothetical protein